MVSGILRKVDCPGENQLIPSKNAATSPADLRSVVLFITPPSFLLGSVRRKQISMLANLADFPVDKQRTFRYNVSSKLVFKSIPFDIRRILS